MKFINFKRILLLFLLAFFVFGLSGCVLFDVDLGIDANNTAFLRYHLELDVSDFNNFQQHNFKQALYRLARYYHDNLGFSVNLEIDTNPLIFTAEKRIANNSFEDAFESLKSMLTDEDMTIFMQVDMAQVSYPRMSGYILNASVDIPRIIKSNELNHLPHSLMRSFDDAIHESSGVITISLPGDEIVAASHTANVADNRIEMTVPLSFVGQTAFELSAKQNIQGGIFDNPIGAFLEDLLKTVAGDVGESFIDEQIRLRSTAAVISLVAIAILALTLIITFVVVLMNRRKA